MSNWNRIPFDMSCPRCGETRLIDREDPLTWYCNVCARSWPLVTTRPAVKDEPQAP